MHQTGSASQTSPRGGPSGEARKRLLVAGGVVALLAVGVGVGVAVSGGSDDDQPAAASQNSGPDAGVPFSPEVQAALAQAASIKGWTLEVGPDTGSCEVLKQVAEHLPVEEPVTLTRANVEAAVGPSGSLFLTVSNWTGGNEEALVAVQSCVDYLVGTQVG